MHLLMQEFFGVLNLLTESIALIYLSLIANFVSEMKNRRIKGLCNSFVSQPGIWWEFALIQKLQKPRVCTIPLFPKRDLVSLRLLRNCRNRGLTVQTWSITAVKNPNPPNFNYLQKLKKLQYSVFIYFSKLLTSQT